jgi:hypothetical protein
MSALSEQNLSMKKVRNEVFAFSFFSTIVCFPGRAFRLDTLISIIGNAVKQSVVNMITHSNPRYSAFPSIKIKIISEEIYA